MMYLFFKIAVVVCISQGISPFQQNFIIFISILIFPMCSTLVLVVFTSLSSSVLSIFKVKSLSSKSNFCASSGMLFKNIFLMNRPYFPVSLYAL